MYTTHDSMMTVMQYALRDKDSITILEMRGWFSRDEKWWREEKKEKRCKKEEKEEDYEMSSNRNELDGRKETAATDTLIRSSQRSPKGHFWLLHQKMRGKNDGTSSHRHSLFPSFTLLSNFRLIFLFSCDTVNHDRQQHHPHHLLSFRMQLWPVDVEIHSPPATVYDPKWWWERRIIRSLMIIAVFFDEVKTMLRLVHSDDDDGCVDENYDVHGVKGWEGDSTCATLSNVQKSR